MSGSALTFSLRSAANLANTNRTAEILRSKAVSFVKTGSGFEACSACDIGDSQEMKRCPALAALSNRNSHEQVCHDLREHQRAAGRMHLIQTCAISVASSGLRIAMARRLRPEQREVDHIQPAQNAVDDCPKYRMVGSVGFGHSISGPKGRVLHMCAPWPTSPVRFQHRVHGRDSRNH